MKTYETYEFNSADQPVKKENRIIYISGYHELIKLKDSLWDKICGRSWYLLDGKTIIDIGRNSYVETRCLQLKCCIGCKYLCYNNSGQAECLQNWGHICFTNNYIMKKRTNE